MSFFCVNNNIIANDKEMFPHTNLRKNNFGKKIRNKVGTWRSPLAPLFVVHCSGMEKVIHRKKFHGRTVYSDTSIWLTSPCGFRCFHRFRFFIRNLYFHSCTHHEHALSQNFWLLHIKVIIIQWNQNIIKASFQLKVIKNVCRQYRAR